MEQSKAVTKLMEVADLAAMVEDMMSPTTMSHLSPASWAGMRITMRNIREVLLACHDTMAAEVVARARVGQSSDAPRANEGQRASVASTVHAHSLSNRIEAQREPARTMPSAPSESAKPRDLRSTLERALNTPT